MPRPRLLPFLGLALIPLAFPALAASAPAASGQGGGLQTINNPGGGQVVYGTLTGQSSLSSAMVFMLRQVHGHFGNKPQIGKFFQSKGSDSTAVFFNVTNANEGNKPLAGMVVVSMPPGGASAAAILYDDAARFSATEPALMKALNAAWHMAPANQASNAPASGSAGQAPSGAGPQPLQNATAGDRSASIGLAPGWRITGVYAGSLTAEGPGGEQISIGLLFQGIRDPRSMQGPAFGPRSSIVCHYGGDAFEAYTCVINQARQNKGLPQASFKLTSEQHLQANPQEQQVVQAIFEMDLHDGKGPRKTSARIGEMHFNNFPTWSMTVSGSNAPAPIFNAVNPTIMAMVHSYSQDRRVINQENAAVINNIHAIGAAAKAQAQAADQRREASSAAFNAHMDNLDRSSKAFQNYTLDQSVVRDNNSSARGTISNSYADALVQANPDRFEIVPNQNLIKGQDY